MQNLITPEALQETAEHIYANGAHPLTAMFGRDETESGVGYVIYCYF